MVISIDRAQPFDLVKFLGEGWAIDEQDEQSLALSEVDFANVRLENMLKKGEVWIKGEEKLERLKKAGYIRLDAKVFQALWENQPLILESWKKVIVYFDGTILRGPGGDRYVLCLYWPGGQWRWGVRWLGHDGGGCGPSAVLASV